MRDTAPVMARVLDVSDGIHHPTPPCPTPQLIGLGSLLKRGKKYNEEDKKTGAA